MSEKSENNAKRKQLSTRAYEPGEMHAAANQAQRAFELEVAAARALDAVRRLELAPPPPQARPNLGGRRGTDSDLER